MTTTLAMKATEGSVVTNLSSVLKIVKFVKEEVSKLAAEAASVVKFVAMEFVVKKTKFVGDVMPSVVEV